MVENDFVEENQTLENSEIGEPSNVVDEPQGSIEQLQETARYMQSEKDKAVAENAKLKGEIQDIKNYLASQGQQQQAPVDNNINLQPDDFEPW